MDNQAGEIARNIIKQLEDSWNAADGEAFGEPFARDADFVAIRGDYHRSREAIAKGHHGIFNSIYKDSRVTYELLQAREVADGVILAHAKSNMSVPSGPLAGDHSATSTLVLVQGDGEWQIAGFHNTLVASPQ